LRKIYYFNADEVNWNPKDRVWLLEYPELFLTDGYIGYTIQAKIVYLRGEYEYVKIFRGYATMREIPWKRNSRNKGFL
jgi:hypothetical protein